LSTTVLTTDPTWALGSNPDLSGEKLVITVRVIPISYMRLKELVILYKFCVGNCKDMGKKSL